MTMKQNCVNNAQCTHETLAREMASVDCHTRPSNAVKNPKSTT